MTKSSQASSARDITDDRTASASDQERHDRDYLTVVQAADFLQLSQSSQTLRREVLVVRSYIREGKLKAFRVAGLRKVLIARGELMKLLEPVELVEPA